MRTKKRISHRLRVALTATAVAATLTAFGFQSASASPSMPPNPNEISPVQVQAAASSAALPCSSDGPTQADANDAATLNPLLTTKMHGYMNSYNTSCARAIVRAVQARGLNQRAAAIALATAIVESSIADLDGGDADSIGLYQQRPSWGSYADRTNPAVATDNFINVMEQFYPNDSWNTAAIGDVAADVQRPAAQYRYRYGVEANDAVTIANLLWSDSGAVGGKSDLVRVNADGTLTAWQNNNALAGSWAAPAGIGNAGTTDQTRLKFADLNGDGKAELIRVNDDGSLTAWQNVNGIAGGWAAPVGIGNAGTTDPTRVEFADLNGDGKDELIRVNDDGSLTAWQNVNGIAGGWAAPVGIGNAGTTDQTRVEFADLNGDGKADLIRVNDDGTLTAWQNSNALADGWAAPVGIGNAGTTDQTRVEFADLNGDGKADLIRVNDDGTLTAWQNNNALADGWAAPVGIGNAGTTDQTRVKFAELG